MRPHQCRREAHRRVPAVRFPVKITRDDSMQQTPHESARELAGASGEISDSATTQPGLHDEPSHRLRRIAGVVLS
jgi:hypothetical protein